MIKVHSKFVGYCFPAKSKISQGDMRKILDIFVSADNYNLFEYLTAV
jgi:hypothetical protein